MKACHALHERGMTIVMITHFMEEAAEADRVAVFQTGRVAMLGTPEEILTRADELARLNLDMPASCRLGRRFARRACPFAHGARGGYGRRYAQAYTKRSRTGIAGRPFASDHRIPDSVSSAIDGADALEPVIDFAPFV
ncbi:MAG: hypothetical protein ACLU37_04700 [Collinsella sp.]